MTKSWPEFHAPYLTSLHASAITCLSHHCDLDQGMMETLEQLSHGHNIGPHHGDQVVGGGGHWSRRQWPVSGGECDQLSGDSPSIIITGDTWHMVTGHWWHYASHYYNQDMKMEKLKSGCHKETHFHFSLVLILPDTLPQMISGTLLMIYNKLHAWKYTCYVTNNLEIIKFPEIIDKFL